MLVLILLRTKTLLGIAWFVCCAVQGMSAERPNIMVILADDVGFSDIGCYGSEIETPTLDALAERGLRFTQFYNMARCCPTRASLLTGLYPHQAGIGHMMDDSGFDGYRGELNRECVTIAEVLKSAGYRTYMAGKWHVTRAVNPKTAGEQHNWPTQRGFDRFYGTIHGAGSFYDPNSLARDNKLISPFADSEYQPEEYYYTDAIADQAAKFVSEHQSNHADSPFFMYVSFTAAHWPMHALEPDIAKYRGKYDAGYESIRVARYQKMLELGVVQADATQYWGLPTAWKESDYLAWDIHNMEVYAAMVDSMDRGIGRIVARLKQTGQFENTLLLYVQDNGGCAENYGRVGEGKPRAETPPLPAMPADALQMDMQPKQTRDGYPIRTGKGVMSGPADTYIGYGKGWATVSNTPFREYKHWIHEGGISTPLIAHWPAGILRPGQLEHTPGHVIDIMATAVDIAGAPYPTKFHNDQKIKAMEGTSLLPIFRGHRLEREALYWEHEGNRGVRRGDFKLVAKDNQKWELYNLARDRSEQYDLAASQPHLVAELSRLWDAYAKRANVLPLTPYRDKSAKFNKNKLLFSLKQNDNLSRFDAPYVVERGLFFEAKLSSVETGVIVAQGGGTHGWGIYIADSKFIFALSHEGQRQEISSTPVSGPGRLIMKLGKDRVLTLRWNGQEIARGSIPKLLAEQPLDGLQIGKDLDGCVGPYTSPNKYPGKIEAVTIRLEK
jgi:arylsulfatase A-like enzyme